MEKFKTLIIGNDINAYYLARCYHELTGEKADLISLVVPGKKTFAYTRYTKILNIKYVENLWDENVFLKSLDDYYNQNKDSKILLISSNETYGEYIAKNQKKLKNKFYFNYPSVVLQQTLVNKEKFYKEYANSIIDLPKTIYFNCKTDSEIKEEVTFPVIVKPANVILYKHIDFVGKKKIYRLNNMKELKEILSIFKQSDYDDVLIIQEYIPGDDSHLFDAVVYSDKKGKVKLVSFAQIGLQEHNPRMIGNAAVLINGYHEFPNVEKQIKKITEFMNTIGYRGFAEFDMKYDSRDGKYKVMEINARQGRSSYYIKPCGYNLVEILARDLIMDEDIKYQVIDKIQLESFVSKSIVKKYIVNDKYKQQVLSLWKDRVNPLVYSKDNGILRKIMLLKIKMNYNKSYKKYKWDWK